MLIARLIQTIGGSILACIPILWTSASQALELTSDFQIHGFATQGIILTSDNNFFGDSNDGPSLDYTELGLNASWTPWPKLQFATQLLSRRAGEGNDGDIELDYGLVDYSLISNETDQWGLRIGRIKNPLGLYNETRDVAFTRPSILLPQSIYFDRTRHLALSADGIHMYAEKRTPMGDFYLQFGAVNPRVNALETELTLLGRDRPGKLNSNMSYIGRLLFEKDNGQLRLALSGAEVNIGYDSALPFPTDLLEGSIRFQPWIISGQYNAERWSLTGEYALRKFKFNNFGGIPNLDFSGESYYLQGTYRFTPEWEGVIRYDVLYANKEDRDGHAYAATTGRPAHNRFAKDLTLGVRWNITPEFMLRAEYHRVDGTAWLPLLDNPDLTTAEQNWDLFAILASYRF